MEREGFFYFEIYRLIVDVEDSRAASKELGTEMYVRILVLC